MARFVRRDVWSLDSDDEILTAYGDAVAAMKAKPHSDPTSWSYQAAIHGSLAAQMLPAYNQCRHGGWYFVSWHRMYLYFFERIVRAQVEANGGPADWALPYWNYERGGLTNKLPRAFRRRSRPDGTPNPLHVGRRAPGINRGAGLPPEVTTSVFALSRQAFTGVGEFGGGATSPLGQFWSQTGRLEQTPHNDVHVTIGGLMGDPDTAAEDPIFWLHHANIDRLWWSWTGRTTRRSVWRDQPFDFFDVGGAPVTMTAAEVVHIERQLRYTYEEPAAPSGPTPVTRLEAPMSTWPEPWPARTGARPEPEDEAPRRELVGATEQPVELTGAVQRVTVRVDRRALDSIRSRRASSQHRAYLDIEDIDAERNPGTVYGVYVNLPEQPTEADLASHHVGNLSLFGVERARDPRGDTHAHRLRVSMEITGVLDQLAEAGQWHDGERIEVTFRRLGLEAPEEPTADDDGDAVPPPEDPVQLGRVSVHFA